MERTNRLLAAVLAVLLLCTLPMAALAELEIELDGGLSLELMDGSAPIGVDLPEPEGVDLTAAPRANTGDEDFDIEDGVVVGYHGEGGDITIPKPQRPSERGRSTNPPW
jgi:hypothetical protein